MNSRLLCLVPYLIEFWELERLPNHLIGILDQSILTFELGGVHLRFLIIFLEA